jgi:hypothetical protein
LVNDFSEVVADISDYLLRQVCPGIEHRHDDALE